MVSVAIIVALYGDSRLSRCAIGLNTSAFTAPIITSPMRSRPSLISTGLPFLVGAFESGAALIRPLASGQVIVEKRPESGTAVSVRSMPRITCSTSSPRNCPIDRTICRC